MAKKTAIDRAIEALEADKRVLELAIEKLKAQQTAKKPVTRKARRPDLIAPHSFTG